MIGARNLKEEAPAPRFFNLQDIFNNKSFESADFKTIRRGKSFQTTADQEKCRLMVLKPKIYKDIDQMLYNRFFPGTIRLILSTLVYFRRTDGLNPQKAAE